MRPTRAAVQPAGVRARGALRSQPDRAVAGLAQAGQHRHQRLLAVAGHAGDGHDLVPVHGQIQAVQARGAVAVAHRHLRQRDHRRRLLGGGHGLGVRHGDLAAHHQFGEFGRRGGGGFALGHQPALAQHGHAPRHRHDFVQLVRNEDDGQALVHEAAQRGEQAVDFLRRQHGGGLVQDQDARAAIQRLQDFNALLLAHRQRADARVGIHAQAEALAQLDQLAAGQAPPGSQLPQRFRAHHDVVQHGQVVGQREVLVHHADPAASAASGRPGGKGCPKTSMAPASAT